jgi:hypothetical protein
MRRHERNSWRMARRAKVLNEAVPLLVNVKEVRFLHPRRQIGNSKLAIGRPFDRIHTYPLLSCVPPLFLHHVGFEGSRRHYEHKEIDGIDGFSDLVPPPNAAFKQQPILLYVEVGRPTAQLVPKAISKLFAVTARVREEQTTSATSDHRPPNIHAACSRNTTTIAVPPRGRSILSRLLRSGLRIIIPSLLLFRTSYSAVKTLVLNAVSNPLTRAMYARALDDFFAWWDAQGLRCSRAQPSRRTARTSSRSSCRSDAPQFQTTERYLGGRTGFYGCPLRSSRPPGPKTITPGRFNGPL